MGRDDGAVTGGASTAKMAVRDGALVSPVRSPRDFPSRAPA